MLDIIVADIGGTHARFAIATLSDCEPIQLKQAITLKTSDFNCLASAMRSYIRLSGGSSIQDAAIAIAAPVSAGIYKLTNNTWCFDPSDFRNEFGLRHCLVINDFCAVAHAVGNAAPAALRQIFGPHSLPPATGNLSVIGPGTGLGVAQLHRTHNSYIVIPTEGGRISFAPQDEVEDAIASNLRKQYGRVSVERIVSGPGLMEIYSEIARAPDPRLIEDVDALWRAGLCRSDETAETSLQRLCAIFGATCGDVALMHGSIALVLTGRLCSMMLERLPETQFYNRFRSKGRYRDLMSQLSIYYFDHAQPGLVGAGWAFLKARAPSVTRPSQ